MPGWRISTAAASRCCPSWRRFTGATAPRSGCSAGASSSWRARNSGVFILARNGWSATICSSRGGREVMGVFRLFNFVAYQLAWFACVLGAAHDLAWAGALFAVAVAALHLALRRDPAELRLVVSAAAIGFV